MNIFITKILFFHGFIQSNDSHQIMLKSLLYPTRVIFHQKPSLNSYVSLMSRISIRELLSIASGVRIAPYSNISGNVVIGDNEKANPFISIHGGKHIGDDGLCQSLVKQFATEKAVIIWNKFWISINSIVTCGKECQRRIFYKNERILDIN